MGQRARSGRFFWSWGRICDTNFSHVDPSTGVITITNTLFLAQYNSSNGSLIWTKEIDDGISANGSTEFSDLEVDGETGLIYVSGKLTQDFIDFDLSSSLGLFPVSGGGTDGFVAVYDMSSNFIDAFTIPNTISSWAYSIAVGNGGALYVGGNYEGIADFAPGSNIFELTASTTDPQLFLAKYSNIVTGIADETQSSSNIYPNPNNGQFTINLNSKEECTIEAFNTLGQALFTEQFNSSNRTSIQLTVKGVYLLVVRTEGEIYSEKVVVE